MCLASKPMLFCLSFVRVGVCRDHRTLLRGQFCSLHGWVCCRPPSPCSPMHLAFSRSLGMLTRAALSPGFSHPCVCCFYHVWNLLLCLCYQRLALGWTLTQPFVIGKILEQSLSLLELQAAGRQKCALERLAWGCGPTVHRCYRAAAADVDV